MSLDEIIRSTNSQTNESAGNDSLIAEFYKQFSETNSQKHLSVALDNRLSLEDHLKMILKKVNKTIGLLRKLQNIPPRSALLTICKSFIRPHLDYGDIIYDQAYNASFHQKLELLQYNACPAITGAIRGTSR